MSGFGGVLRRIWGCGGMADTGDLIPDELSSRYKTYTCKDGRMRIYDRETKKVTSYPRFLMEQSLGRPLAKNEHVHHIDENPLNNNLSNLEVLSAREHAIHHHGKYHDREMVCPWCGKSFLWSKEQQVRHYSNASRRNRPNMAGPFCSNSCAGSYGRFEQLSREAKTECE